ncbi:MAG TPA: hypothetical protein GX747_00130, partial [Tenericutes bacterium]|nr:hypothetical protein [Mycoplasmatota bacterium]
MINLLVKNNLIITDVQILKENNVIYNNKKQILNFYRYFDEAINEKNDTIVIKIGEKKVTSKDYILINLLDLQSVLDSIKYKRGNIIYDYINIL